MIHWIYQVYTHLLIMRYFHELLVLLAYKEKAAVCILIWMFENIQQGSWKNSTARLKVRRFVFILLATSDQTASQSVRRQMFLAVPNVWSISFRLQFTWKISKISIQCLQGRVNWTCRLSSTNYIRRIWLRLKKSFNIIYNIIRRLTLHKLCSCEA